MSGRRALFSKADLVRAVKALQESGAQGGRIEIAPDRMTVILGPAAQAAGGNSFDKIIGER